MGYELTLLVKAGCVVIPLVACIGLYRRYLDKLWGHCKSTHSLRGKTYLITGANSGIGLETAKALVKRNARVIFACRNVEAARKVIDDIRRCQKTGGEMIIMELDLSSIASIKSFAELVKTGFSKLDCLINNAGVYTPLQLDEKTKDGFESQFGVNHLGHFLLAQLLIDLLKNAAPSRVVIVSSLLHESGKIDFEDLNLTKAIAELKDGTKKPGRSNPGYNNSKLMNVYFGRGLSERTKEFKIDVFTVCPGFTYTNLFRKAISWYHFIPMAPILIAKMRSAKQGAQTVLHCATDSSLEGSSERFFRDCKPYQSKVDFSKEVEDQLWDVTKDLIASSKAMANDQALCEEFL